MKKSIKLFLVYLIYICLPVNSSAQEQLKIDIHGYISQGFMYSNRNNYLADTEKGTFQFNELGINFAVDLTDKLRLGIQLAARDLGDLGNDKVLIDWAYADYRWQDWLGIRIGQIKLTMGFYNKARDQDMLRTFILLPQSIYGETFRDTSFAMKGISVYGNIPLKVLGDISYEVLFGTMNINVDSSTTKAIEERGGKVEKYEVGGLFNWSAAWETPLQGLRFGVSQNNIRNFRAFATLTDDITISVPYPPYTITVAEKGDPVCSEVPSHLKTVLSVEYTLRDLVLAAEYSWQNQTVLRGRPGSEPMEIRQEFEGFYGSANYRFSDWLEIGTYYSVFYKNRGDRDGTKTPHDPTFSAFQKDACLTFRFDLNDHWAFKLEGHLMDGVGLCFRLDNLDDSGAPEFDRKWYLLAAKMTFSF